MVRKIQCRLCKKMIDNDSIFCKYCGVKAVEEQILDGQNLGSFFQKILETLYSNSNYTKIEFDQKFDVYKNYENKAMNNNDYYQLLVDIIFYSGFKASTVDKYLDTIHSYFSDYKVAMKYSIEQAEEIKSNPKMIRHRAKIDACIKNAKKMDEIVSKNGSVQAYIDSFKPNTSDGCLFDLKKSLERNFGFLGGVTSYHFMTDIGLNVLKPDRVILRIFYRLGLIVNENDLLGAVKMGRAFSAASNLPIRYIDIIFVMYGQLDQENLECICSEKNPKCQKCGVKTDCQYAKQRENI